MMSKLIQFSKLSYQASPTPQEAQQKLKSLISLLMDLKTAVLNHPKKKRKTTTINVMVIVTMPGLVDPVVKKIQCTVDPESD